MPGKGKSRSKSAKKSAGKRRASSRPSRGKKSAPKARGSGRKKNISEMKALLLERRADLFQGVEHNLKYQSSPSATKGDSSDLAANALDSDTAMQLAESGSSELAQIDQALQKMEEGTYGQCEACNADIPWGRLEAVPYATLCVACKERQERTGTTGTSAAGWSAVDEFETLERDM
ncbi:MAG: TraR/DksA family transcriptional regulator [Planctomycetota bacterium]|jgi:DnaK suppressor protein